MTLAVNLAQGASNNVTFRNRIINGGMNISQGANGASVTPTVAGSYATNYAVDRFNTFATVASKYTIQQTPSATETGFATRVGAGFRNYLAVTSSSAYSVGSTDYFLISQSIEGFNTADLAFGTSNAKTVTLSFWAYSSLTGTFGGSLSNSALSRAYPFSYTISSANTWTQISVTIAGDTSGTWVGSTNGTGLTVFFNLGSGTSQSTTAGAWATGFYTAPTGATSVVGTSGATFYITGVQLEAGTTASPFEYRQYGTELALCQRYFWKIGGTVTEEQICMGLVDGGSNVSCITSLPVAMRTAPSVGYSSASAFLINDAAVQIATTAVAIYKPALQTIGIVVTVASGLTLGRAARFFIGNSLSAYINFSAEL